MKITRLVNKDGEIIAANLHTPDGTIRWSKGKKPSLETQEGTRPLAEEVTAAIKPKQDIPIPVLEIPGVTAAVKVTEPQRKDQGKGRTTDIAVLELPRMKFEEAE